MKSQSYFHALSELARVQKVSCYLLVTVVQIDSWERNLLVARKHYKLLVWCFDVAMDWLAMCSSWIFVKVISWAHSLTQSWRSKILPECPAETSGHLHMQLIACYWSFCRYPKSCIWNDILHTCNGTLLVTEAFADTQNLVCEVIFHIPVVTTLVILASKFVHFFCS
jgi:hypothetical protein